MMAPSSRKPGWFDDARIEKTVTKEFVRSYLTPDEAADLDEPLAFGDGLTNDTYWEWIESKAKRLFLILVDLGVPDQIFGVIDDSGWEDDDLPLPRDQVHQLALTEEPDPKMDAKFYDQQFCYLLRTLDAGQHVDYSDDEMVPMDVVERRPASSHQDVVELPNFPHKTFGRRAVQLGVHMSMDEFKSEINMIRTLQHDHIESYFASYTHKNVGYVLFTPASEYKLASYLTSTPASLKPLKTLDKLAQRRLVLEWINCLVNTLSHIHSRGDALGNIKSSTILATHDHHILFPDNTYFNPQTHNPISFSKEAYNYAAPEQFPARSPGPPSPPTVRPRAVQVPSGNSHSSCAPRSRGAGVPSRAASVPSKVSHNHASSPDTCVSGRPSNPAVRPRPVRMTSSPSIRSPSHSSRGAGVAATSPSTSTPLTTSHKGTIRHQTPPPSRPTHLALPSPLPVPSHPSNPTQAADIFSLGCILLELLSHLLKRTPSAFAAVRSAKHKNPGRGGAVLDASFHRNLGQVHVWVAGLAKDAAKKAKTRGHGHAEDGDAAKARVYAAVGPLLAVVERMLAVQPGERPTAAQVAGWVGQIVTEVGGLRAPHCVDRACNGPRGAGKRGSVSSSINYVALDLATSPAVVTPSVVDDSGVESFSRGSSRAASSAPTIRSKRSSVFSVQSWSTHHRDHDDGDGLPSLVPSVSQPAEDRWGAAVMQSLKMGLARSKFSPSPPLAR